MKKNLVILLLFIISSVSAQENKRPLTFDDILKWNRITEKMISNDGNYIIYKAEPWKGDPILKVVNKSGKELLNILGGNAQITSDSKFALFEILTPEEQIRQLKLKKTKKEDMPKEKLGVFNFSTSQLDTIKNIESYKTPVKWSGWIAYQTKTTVIADTVKSEEKKEIKKENEENGFLLCIKNINSGEVIQIPFVKDYIFAKDNNVIVFVSTGDEKDFKPGIYWYDLKNNVQKEILLAKGDYKQIALNKNALRVAFLADTTNDKSKQFSLFLWEGNASAQKIVKNDDVSIPENWEISTNCEILITEKTDRIFFGIAPKKPEKDTTKLDEEIPQLDIWRWNEPRLYTEQINTLKSDLKKSYLTVYDIEKENIKVLEQEFFTGIELINHGDADYLYAWSNLPYSVQTMWEGDPQHNDFYLVDIKTAEVKLIKKDCRAVADVSPEGKYLFWYNAMDTSWNTYNIESNQEFKITSPKTVQCADELNDIPNPPESYGMACWLKNDEGILIYDRYDIWKVDAENKTIPVNITKNGRLNNISYRLIDFDNIYQRSIGEGYLGHNSRDEFLLLGHNEITRNEGYYQLNGIGSNFPDPLIVGSFKLNRPIKSKDAQVLVYTKETFELFPDLLITESNFKKSKTISNVNPQQKDFLWGTKELYSWTSLDGRKLEGLLIKPANFDPTKKYPMIVNFYEKSSQNLYDHQIPEAHRSTVDYHYYSSNGYIIFNPDIYYKEGYPGEDAFNCVMPGVTQLISEGFVDEKHIAAQGHSWGGYQVAYLATRTNLFAAIESGAPVVNMFSAYGGIRLWTGLNRSFQYEHTQSRIGKSIWEAPLRYLENSPLYTVDKINTPLLIMHNENDGAVPFSQGVEFFIALRRLGKQAWLLNYNEADHWPTKVRDKYDFQIRLAQFFDHFLKDAPMPEWMKEGIPAVNKGYDLGYELDNEK